MKTEVLLHPKILDGVQIIVLVDYSPNPLFQRYLVVQDANDRGTGTGICKYGLAGGGILDKENRETAAIRECKEELGMDIFPIFHSSFRKLRPGGYENMNHLFFSYLSLSNGLPKQSNDPLEVAAIELLTLEQIIELYQEGKFHEGSIRLIFHYLNGSEEGSLNNPVSFQHWTF